MNFKKTLMLFSVFLLTPIYAKNSKITPLNENITIDDHTDSEDEPLQTNTRKPTKRKKKRRGGRSSRTSHFSKPSHSIMNNSSDEDSGSDGGYDDDDNDNSTGKKSDNKTFEEVRDEEIKSFENNFSYKGPKSEDVKGGIKDAKANFALSVLGANAGVFANLNNSSLSQTDRYYRTGRVLDVANNQNMFKSLAKGLASLPLCILDTTVNIPSSLFSSKAPWISQKLHVPHFANLSTNLWDGEYGEALNTVADGGVKVSLGYSLFLSVSELVTKKLGWSASFKIGGLKACLLGAILGEYYAVNWILSYLFSSKFIIVPINLVACWFSYSIGCSYAEEYMEQWKEEALEQTMEEEKEKEGEEMGYTGIVQKTLLAKEQFTKSIIGFKQKLIMWFPKTYYYTTTYPKTAKAIGLTVYSIAVMLWRGYKLYKYV